MSDTVIERERPPKRYETGARVTLHTLRGEPVSATVLEDDGGPIVAVSLFVPRGMIRVQRVRFVSRTRLSAAR